MTPKFKEILAEEDPYLEGPLRLRGRLVFVLIAGELGYVHLRHGRRGVKLSQTQMGLVSEEGSHCGSCRRK